MKMNMLKFLIASGLISLGAKRVYAESIKVPEEIETVNIEEFQACLRAPYDSLTVKAREEEANIDKYGTAGDTTGLRSSRERQKEDSERGARIGEAVKSINSSTYGRFTNFNTAINDSLITSGEAGNLLSRVELDQRARDTYQEIAGHEAYVKVDEAVARFNADVDNLLARVSETRSEEVGRSEVAEVPRSVETPKKPSEEKEQDYTKMDRPKLEIIAGSTYGDEIVSANLGFRTPIYERFRMGLSTEYGEQPGNSSDVTLHQRGRLTGFRAEASQVVDKSLLGVSAELAYGNELYGLVSAGLVKRFTEVEKEEKLYDRDNNLLGSDSNKNTDEKWYGRFMAGVGYRNGSLGVEGSAGVIGKKNAAARFNINYNF